MLKREHAGEGRRAGVFLSNYRYHATPKVLLALAKAEPHDQKRLALYVLFPPPPPPSPSANFNLALGTEAGLPFLSSSGESIATARYTFLYFAAYLSLLFLTSFPTPLVPRDL